MSALAHFLARRRIYMCYLSHKPCFRVHHMIDQASEGGEEKMHDTAFDLHKDCSIVLYRNSYQKAKTIYPLPTPSFACAATPPSSQPALSITKQPNQPAKPTKKMDLRVANGK
jgi:hypothetical protein